jgi:hypothetical protein
MSQNNFRDLSYQDEGIELLNHFVGVHKREGRGKPREAKDNDVRVRQQKT